MSVIHQSDAYFMANMKYFPADKAVYLKEKLRTMDNEKILHPEENQGSKYQ